MKTRISIALSILSTAAILFFTLRPGATWVTHGWSFDLWAGDTALADLIANLLLFLPLGLSLTLAGVRPWRVVALGALLSCTVEFLQQWIPGRDPSVGDILCNTISTALGALLVARAPAWLFVSPRRSAWQARLTAIVAVLVWYGTGAMVRHTVPPMPYHIVTTPDFEHYGLYDGRIVNITPGLGSLEVTAVAAPSPPGQTSPLFAVLDRQGVKVIMLSVDGADLTLRYSMPALQATLEQPDLRLRGALRGVAPGDTFIAKTWHDSTNVCLRVNATERCHLGYTIGDGWKLIYYPQGRPAWMLGLLNMLWIAGGVIGVGYWGARSGGEKDGGENNGGEGRRGGGGLAIGIVIAGILLVPLLTGLKATPITEWIGALAGMGVGYLIGLGLFDTRAPQAAGYTTPPSHPGQTS